MNTVVPILGKQFAEVRQLAPLQAIDILGMQAIFYLDNKHIRPIDQQKIVFFLQFPFAARDILFQKVKTDTLQYRSMFERIVVKFFGHLTLVVAYTTVHLRQFVQLGVGLGQLRVGLGQLGVCLGL
ncbi:hypothetical protein [uncultured Thiohalocapsa sp.]|uniref:hypothetical protein n=1 Tax=uncultured Thiohalocapsa sp. TaxID=768990 RepID=UPI003457F62E